MFASISSIRRCSFALQAPARLNAVQIAVNVELEHHGRVISRAAGLGRLHAFETEPGKIKFVNEDIDDPDRVQ
jgi:hypothetical protein